MGLLLTDDINDYCFIDTETRALPHLENTDHRSSVRTAGAYLYAKNSFVTIITYAIGNNPVQLVALPHFDTRLTWDQLPQDLQDFYLKAEAGKGWFVAWNAAFDRLALSNLRGSHDLIRPELFIDAMAQAVASNLPASLEGAAQVVTGAGKQEDGKALIAMFATPNGETPQTAPAQWERFISYAVTDTDQMRNVYLSTRPLLRREWVEYWASEAINDRGIAVDVPFVERAAAIASANTARTNAALRRLTGGDLRTVTQHVALAEWVYDRVTYAEAREILVKKYAEDDENDLVPDKLSLERSRVEALIVFFEDLDARLGLTDEEWDLLQILQLRQFGASNTPQKFGKMAQQAVDGRLHGQYVWNGASQTGRFSSRGVQIHNLVNKTLGKGGNAGGEIEAINAIIELDEF